MNRVLGLRGAGHWSLQSIHWWYCVYSTRAVCQLNVRQRHWHC